MSLQSRNEDVFLLCESATGNGPMTIGEVTRDGGKPVVCNFVYRPGSENRAKIDVCWNRVSEQRVRNGDLVDLTMTVTRRGGNAAQTDRIDVEFPVTDASLLFDPAFACVAAASFHCKTPDLLAGVELLIASEHGFHHGLALGVGSIGHGATGYRFTSVTQEAKLVLRLHMKPTDQDDETFIIRFARVFFGMQYDVYAFNPHYEYAALQNPPQREPAFAEVAADFIRAAREQSKLHKFAGSQAFIMPFEAVRIGKPTFPMLCGSVNSLYWYGMKPKHGVVEYDELVQPGEVVFDCGAHAGQMSALFGHMAGPSGKVYAFEPFPQNYLQVEAQGRLNKLKNFVSTRAGVGAKRETIEVPNAVQMILSDSDDHGLKDHLAIDIHRLDDYIDVRPTAIKLDIEGAEVAALHGAQRVLHECKPKIFCEFHTQLVGQFGHTVQDFFDAIPHDLYHVQYAEEGRDGLWRTYTKGERQEWTMPGTITAFPK